MNTAMNSFDQTKDIHAAYSMFQKIINDVPASIEQLKDNEDIRQKNMNHPYIIRTIFSEHPECWDNKRGARLRPEQERAAWCIANCKTRNMNGFTAGVCPGCGYTMLHYKSCGNRNCPSCQLPMQLQWIEDRKKEVIPGQPYFHIILTFDHRLNPLFQYNQRVLVSLFHNCASSAIIEICRDPHYLGAVPGIISVLHSWTQELQPHWHLHCVVSGCGLTKENKFVSILDAGKRRKQDAVSIETASENQWDEIAEACVDDDDEKEDVEAGEHVYFLPMAALTNLFRNKFMDGLRDLWKKKELVIPESHSEWIDFVIWSDFCRSVSTTKWIVKLVKAFHGKGKTNAIEYLARYVFRTAISNSRITAYDGKFVTFRVRDNHNPGQHKECRLPVEEFIRRLLSHVLESRVTRVRYSGFLNCARRRKNLALIARLLNHPQMLKLWSDERSVNKLQDKPGKNSTAEMMSCFFQQDICKCPHCKSPLILWPPRPLTEKNRRPPAPELVLSPRLDNLARFRARIKAEKGRKAWDRIHESLITKLDESPGAHNMPNTFLMKESEETAYKS